MTFYQSNGGQMNDLVGAQHKQANGWFVLDHASQRVVGRDQIRMGDFHLGTALVFHLERELARAFTTILAVFALT